MRFLKLHLFVFFALIASVSAHAETLEGAVSIALQTHPSVEAGRAALDVVRQERRAEFSGYFPELSVTGTGGRIFGDNATSRGTVTSRGEAYSYLWEGSATLRQLLFDGFGIQRRVDSINARKISADMTLKDIQENLAFNMVQAYVDLLRANKALLMIKQQMAKVNDYAGRIETAVDEGVSDDAELQQAIDVKAVLEGLVAEYKGQVAAAESRYLELVGALPETEMDNPIPATALIFEGVEEAVAYATESHNAIQAAEMTVKSAGYDVKAEEATLYPEFNGELSYLESDKREEIGGEVTDAKAVVRMNWGFETGLGQYARIRQKRHTMRESRARYEEIKKQVERGVRLAYAEYDTSIDLLNNQTRRAKLARDLFDTYEVQFEGARVSLLQLMQSDNQYFTARLEQMNGAHRALLAQYAILASLGRLNESLNQTVADVR